MKVVQREDAKDVTEIRGHTFTDGAGRPQLRVGKIMPDRLREAVWEALAAKAY